MLSVYYPELRKFRQLEKINNVLNINQYKKFIQYSDTINQSFFTQPEKNIFFNYGMGAGKTSQTIIYIKERLRVEPALKVLVITPNITLSRGIYYRLNKMGLNFEHYNEE